MNNINFNGKQEVIYGLKKAAECANSAECYRAASFGPRPHDKSILEKIDKSKMKAYLDMVCIDDTFTNSLSDIGNKDLLVLSQLLSPVEYQYGKTNPFNLFKNSLINILELNKKNALCKPLEDFLNNLEKKM